MHSPVNGQIHNQPTTLTILTARTKRGHMLRSLTEVVA